MSLAELVEVADSLYAGAPDAFVPARDAAARRAASDRALAKQIKTLKKPSIAAWAVNQLVRRESQQIEQVLTLAESLRAAAESLDGEELRALTRQRRQLTAALTATARGLAREYDVRLTSAVADQVEAMLNAALLDPVAGAALRSGLVLTGFASTGVSRLDVGAVCAVPEAIGTHRATPIEEVPPERPTLQVVPDNGVRLEAARERLAEAINRVTETETELDGVDERTQELQARRLQLQGDMDELRRRLDGLESSVDDVDADLEEAGLARDEVVEELEEAKRSQAQAEAALERLE